MIHRVDMHIHTNISDGSSSPAEMVEAALRRGLSGVAVCDHNTAEGYHAVLREARGTSLLIIPAVEYSTPHGHMLAYFVDVDAAACGMRMPRGGYDAAGILEFVHEEGGLLFAAHPFRDPNPPVEIYAMLDGIEALNSRSGLRYAGANERSIEYACRTGGLFSAGSDAHSAAEVGRAYMSFECDGELTAGIVREQIISRAAKAICRSTRARDYAAAYLSSGFKRRRIKQIVKGSRMWIRSLAEKEGDALTMPP